MAGWGRGGGEGVAGERVSGGGEGGVEDTEAERRRHRTARRRPLPLRWAMTYGTDWDLLKFFVEPFFDLGVGQVVIVSIM